MEKTITLSLTEYTDLVDVAKEREQQIIEIMRVSGGSDFTDFVINFKPIYVDAFNFTGFTGSHTRFKVSNPSETLKSLAEHIEQLQSANKNLIEKCVLMQKELEEIKKAKKSWWD